MSDDELIAKFEACTLSGECFHHAQHVQVAFLYLNRYPVVEALRRFSNSLAAFAAANGKPERYHQTITWAFVLLIHERMARASDPQTWAQFAESNPDLLDWKDNILKKYYRDETLNSDLARRAFVFPDRITPSC